MNTLGAHIPIAEVTVFEDRAHVVRRGLVQFPKGLSRIELNGVAPTLIDKTVSVNVLGPVQPARVRVVRQRITAGETSAAQAWDATRAKVARHLTELQGTDHAMSLMLDEVAQDAASGRGDRTTWDNAWSQLFEHAQAAFARWELAQAPLTPREREDHAVAVLQLELESEDTGPHPIQVDYVVPNAAWRPHYRVDCGGDNDGRLRFECDARVWQHTGEDWRDAVLFFSTQRPSRPSGPPKLESDVLTAERISKPPPEPEPVSQTEREFEVGEALSPNDGGRTQWLSAAARSTILSTHSSSLVPVTSFQTSPHELINKADHPLLAGPVDVLHKGGLSHRTVVGLVEPGAGFELSLDPPEDVPAPLSPQASPS